MRLSLSTNWCNRRIDRGEEIADLALALGFGELELGYHTTPQQAEGFKRRLDELPVGSVHAFCPVPISAPQGYPELYALASFDAEDRKMAQIQVRRTLQFAAEMGSDTVVLHAGRVYCETWFKRNRSKKRTREGLKMVDIFKGELSALVPELEKSGVTLALENLPYFEGFPDETEAATLLDTFRGAPVKAWFDTGHHRVRECNKWLPPTFSLQPSSFGLYQGMHLNDVVDLNDDHLAPGFGKVDFVALKPLAESVRHVVFEPNAEVSETALKNGLAYIKNIWSVP